jgi:mitochondrial protein import protein ZIM17
MEAVAAAAIATTTSRTLLPPFSSTPIHRRRRAAFLPVAASKRTCPPLSSLPAVLRTSFLLCRRYSWNPHACIVSGQNDDEKAENGSRSGSGSEPTSLAPYGLSISPLSKVRTILGAA